jgi:hypothetical protein
MSTLPVSKFGDERLKVREVAMATALVAFAAGAITVSFAFLAFQSVVMGGINKLKKGK